MVARSKRATFVCRLVLKNVKSFAGEQVLELTDGHGNPARWTLLLGDNGVGKTTLLECLAHLSPRSNSHDLVGAQDPRLFVEPLIAAAENAVIYSLGRVDANDCEARATYASDALLDRDAGTETVETWISFKMIEGRPEDIVSSRWPAKEEEAVPESQWEEFSKIREPLVMAYSAGRHMGLGNLNLDNLREGTSSLLNADTELFDAEEMILHLDYASLKPRAATAKHQKQLLLETLAALLPEVRRAANIVIYGPSALGERRKKGVYVRTPDGEVPLRQLSFGYQTMMAWICDLAWRLFVHNPRSNHPLNEPAIVIVDEIDLHLHPSWQRQIRSLLTRHFPNVQFIATAHSPLIAQAFLDANLAVVMRDGNHSMIENDPVAVATWRLDQIVTSDLFDLASPWPPEVDALFEEQARLLADPKRTPEQRVRLAEIEAKMLELPTEENPADETALSIIRSAARDLRARDRAR